MARQAQLASLANIVANRVKDIRLGDLEEDDLVEVAAILMWRMHVRGNQEGQANVKSTRWHNVSRSWQGKYRRLVRECLENKSTN